MSNARARPRVVGAIIVSNKNRSIVCEECTEPRRTQFSFDVCPGCVDKLPKSLGAGCDKLRYKVDPDPGLCRRCVAKQKPQIVCEGCGVYDHAFTHRTVYCR